MRWSIVLLVGLAGCPGAAPPGDDMPDAGPTGASLHVTWTPVPADLPGDITSDLSVDRVTFGVASLRVVGDAGPGDPRTFLDDLKLEWDRDGKPDAVKFSNAPPGLYSRMEWLLDTSNLLREDDPIYVFEIVGEVELNGHGQNFRLRETAQLPISFAVSANLDPPADTTIDVRVDVARIVEAVDYDALPKVDGDLFLGPGDPQMPAIRSKVVEAFASSGSPAN
jgi:hypothetical protein